MRSSLSLFTIATILKAAQAVESASNRLPLFLYVDGGSSATPEMIKDEFLKMSDNGVSTIILAFYMTDSSDFPENLADMALAWKNLDSDTRQEIREALNERGTNILVSAGGEAENGNWIKHGATEYGRTFCSLAKDLNLDGVDFDLEGIGHFDTSISQWLHESAKGCKLAFPEAIITSAPQSPYFDTTSGSHGHGWDDILLDGQADGSAHDHLLIQYYNQGIYYSANTYDVLFGNSKPYSIGTLMNTYPDAPSKTFVIGKPYRNDDGAAADWVSTESLREMGCRAWKEIHWRGGFMFWQHHFGADDATFADYKALTEPCDGASEDTKTTSTRPKTPAARPTMPTRASGSRATSTQRVTSTQRATTKPKTSRRSATTQLRTGSTGPLTKATTGTPKIDSPIVRECKSKVVGVQSQYDTGCQNLCEWYGGDGAPQCATVPTDSEDLVYCLTSINTWCTKQ